MLALARACAHECLLGRSVADIMCIKQYTYSMSCARPCALLHDPAFLENLHLLSSSFIPKQPLGGPWANLVTLLVQPQKHIGVRCLPSPPLPVSAGRLS